MTKVSTTWVPAMLAGMLVLVVTLVQGFWTERWTAVDDGGELARAAQALESSFPDRFGDWQMQGVIAANPKELERAGAVGAVSRTYKNNLSKVQVSAFVVCAAAHDASKHTPDRCYPGAGFQIGESEHRHGVTLPDGREVETFTGTFIKDGQTLRIFWTYGVPWRSHDKARPGATSASEPKPGDTPALNWIAPSIARIALNGERAVYKLYAIIDQTNLTGSVSMTTGSEFVAEVLSAFDAQLVATRQGSASETVAQEKRPPARDG
jgi:hypothetical protein